MSRRFVNKKRFNLLPLLLFCALLYLLMGGAPSLHSLLYIALAVFLLLLGIGLYHSSGK